MKRALASLSSFVLIAFLVTSCQNNPTEPTLPEVSPNEQIATDLQLAKPNGLDKQPVTALPFWARVEPPIPPVGYIGMPATEDWAIIYFYTQDPSDIPTDFNLLTFFDFRALQFGVSFSGSAWFQPGNFAPFLQIIKGNGHVKFWVITRAQADAAVADGSFTMAELESLNPMKGEATRFFEALYPFGGGAPVNGLNARATGWLSNGKTFFFKADSRFPGGSTQDGFFRTTFILRD